MDGWTLWRTRVRRKDLGKAPGVDTGVEGWTNGHDGPRDHPDHGPTLSLWLLRFLFSPFYLENVKLALGIGLYRIDSGDGKIAVRDQKIGRNRGPLT